MKIPFYKMNGCGNDFVMIDHRDHRLSRMDRARFIQKICARRTGIGADGVILIEPSETAHFRWHYYNADGKEAEMCGNGARCVALLAYRLGIAPQQMTFEALTGIVSAEIFSTANDNRVKVSLPEPTQAVLDENLWVTDRQNLRVCSINTGVPHAILFVDNLEQADVMGMGRSLRYHPHFQPQGTNSDFVFVRSTQELLIRTYERGVEDETLACGTGAVASALIAAAKGQVESPAKVLMPGGELTVYFQRKDNRFTSVFLEGHAEIVFEGVLTTYEFTS